MISDLAYATCNHCDDEIVKNTKGKRPNRNFLKLSYLNKKKTQKIRNHLSCLSLFLLNIFDFFLSGSSHNNKHMHDQNNNNNNNNRHLTNFKKLNYK